ncbi:RecT family recombinase [Microbacterium sp. 2FI]|uniref:RecT family recombinase n=1 Tax=Microbacterium sp. 2FI TaxID=2502193 RepID=UPI002016698B|nr:RecT family recombinase [Microbacterium sp. 2FI]
MTVEVLQPTSIMLPTTADPEQWSDDQKALLDFAGLVVRKKNQAPVPAPKSTVIAFLQQCERTGLDPIARQIYAIERGGKWTIQVSIDGMRLVAQRSRLYRGQSKAQWTDGTRVRTPMRDLDGSIVREGDGSIVWTEDYQWFDVWTGPGHPVAARVSVYRADFDEPLQAVARWDTYKVENDEWQNGSKTGRKILAAQWEKGGDNQIAKCAEALALRKAFPMDLSGLYATEEMEHLDQEPAPRAPRPAASLTPGTRSAQREPLPVDETLGGGEPSGVGPPASEQESHGRAAPEIVLFPCARCGVDGIAHEEGAICEPCEIEVQEEFAEANA